jgi:hypothetical protein
MKTIKINESQRRRLFETYTEGFSFENLSMMGVGFGNVDVSENQYKYCCKYLGEPLDYGSSRYVFQLDDNFVLKLAIGYEGFKQNEGEVEAFEEIDSQLIARIAYYDDNYSFIVSEQVLPANEEDFEKILGMPYHDSYIQQSTTGKDSSSSHGGDATVGFDKYFNNIIPRGTNAKPCVYNILRYIQYSHKVRKDYDELIDNNWWFSEIRRIVKKYGIHDLYINNFGLAYRNSKPILVILDSGVNRAQEEEEE